MSAYSTPLHLYICTNITGEEETQEMDSAINYRNLSMCVFSLSATFLSNTTVLFLF